MKLASSILHKRLAHLVNGLHSFPSSATPADSVPNALVPGLQFGVTGTPFLIIYVPFVVIG